ncbi:MAG: RloB family protein [Planctomycetaceae bacterium]|jgi:hypothetical protein|nr:RloB family protein [Planctomycetaceae bacterium]
MSKSHYRKKDRKCIKNNIKRRPSSRNAYEKIFIVVEGHSEEKYFNTLKRHWKLHTVVVENPDCTDPINLLDKALKLLEESNPNKNTMLEPPFDEVWIVYDLEQPNNERRKLSKDAKNRAKQKSNIHFAISDPSFEFWYILHYETTTKSFTDANNVEQYLKRYWKNYTKNSEPTLEIVEKTTVAIKNAQWLRKQLESNYAEAPMTDVDQLVVKLTVFSSKNQ